MKDLIRRESGRGLRSLRDEIDRLFDLSLSGFGETTFGAWMPSVDVHEDANTLTFAAELTGMKKDDIKVDVDGEATTADYIGELATPQNIVGCEDVLSNEPTRLPDANLDRGCNHVGFGKAGHVLPHELCHGHGLTATIYLGLGQGASVD